MSSCHELACRLACVSCNIGSDLLQLEVQRDTRGRRGKRRRLVDADGQPLAAKAGRSNSSSSLTGAESRIEPVNENEDSIPLTTRACFSFDRLCCRHRQRCPLPAPLAALTSRSLITICMTRGSKNWISESTASV